MLFHCKCIIYNHLCVGWPCWEVHEIKICSILFNPVQKPAFFA